MYNFGTISNTTINANGHSIRMHSNSLSPFGCGSFSCSTFGGSYTSFGSYSPGCFGFGYGGGYNNCNPFAFGAGAGLGMAAGMVLFPMLPSFCKGIGKAGAWVWNHTMKPIGRGVSNLWHKVFHKKTNKAKEPENVQKTNVQDVQKTKSTQNTNTTQKS